MMKDLITKNRSCRRFFQGAPVEIGLLKGLVDLARLSPSSANLQPIKYMLSCDAKKNNLIFPHLKWAGYLRDWNGPREGERPSAYIILLGDTEISRSFGYDGGIAAQSILLGAAEKGLGGCIVGSIDREGLRRTMEIPSRYEILLVLALGKPAERAVIESVGVDGNIEYWRDPEGVHHVPKRSTEELILDSARKAK